jgi:hypothetical protein
MIASLILILTRYEVTKMTLLHGKNGLRRLSLLGKNTIAFYSSVLATMPVIVRLHLDPVCRAGGGDSWFLNPTFVAGVGHRVSSPAPMTRPPFCADP